MTKQTCVRAALFDLDGVLIDTEPEYTRIWEDIEQYYPTGVENFALKIKGTTLPNILNTYFPSPKIQIEVKKQLAVREAAMDYPLMSGVMEFLIELKAAGIPAAIVTSSGDKKMKRLFEMTPGFLDCFADVITDSRVKNSKPHPEGYITAARSLGANVSDCWVFEDSFNGLRAGRAAGATVIALATSNPHESLIDFADKVIDGFTGFTLDDMLAISKL